MATAPVWQNMLQLPRKAGEGRLPVALAFVASIFASTHVQSMSFHDLV
jgi:hypothetical protein